MTLVGAWHAKSNADCEVLSALANRRYLEERVVDLLAFDDCPVWSVGQNRGVASKIDALFAISKVFTENDLNDFFLIAEYVLAESGPALELPEDQRGRPAFTARCGTTLPRCGKVYAKRSLFWPFAATTSSMSASASM